MRRIKVVYSGGPTMLVKVLDAESGQPIAGVLRVIWYTPRSERISQDRPRCVLVMADVAVELETDAEMVTAQ